MRSLLCGGKDVVGEDTVKEFYHRPTMPML